MAVNKREEQALGYAEQQRGRAAVFSTWCRRLHRDDHGGAASKSIRAGERQVPTQEITVRDATGKETPVEMDLILVRGSDHTAGHGAVARHYRSQTPRTANAYVPAGTGSEGHASAPAKSKKPNNILENLLENANDVIYTLDSEQCFTYVNSKIEAWGYQKEDSAGAALSGLCCPNGIEAGVEITLDIGVKQVYEVEVLTQSG